MYNLFSCFTAPEARMMRVAVGSFMDLLILATNTIAEFHTDTYNK